MMARITSGCGELGGGGSIQGAPLALADRKLPPLPGGTPSRRSEDEAAGPGSLRPLPQTPPAPPLAPPSAGASTRGALRLSDRRAP